MERAFVTLATNDSYCIGALVVASSLRLVHTNSAIVCMITPQVSQPMRIVLEKTFSQVFLVDLLDSRDADNLFLLDRPDLGVTFTKLQCWRLEQYKKCVFLDADTLVLSNCDELFEREELSAAPDPGWPDCFNSGVFVYTPNKDTYRKLVQFAVKEGSFDGGDQGLLNLYFSDWAHTDISKHLPFIYNVVSQAFYSYLPAFKRFGSQSKICHFIGAVKPWHHSIDSNTGDPVALSGTGFSSEFLKRWWHIFICNVKPLLQQAQLHVSDVQPVQPYHLMESLMPQITGVSFASPTEYQEKTELQRQQDWERGIVDYTGADSFETIKKHLDMKLAEQGSPTLYDVRPKEPASTSSSADTRPKEPTSVSLTADTRPKEPASTSIKADTRPKASVSGTASLPKDARAQSKKPVFVSTVFKPIKGVLKKPKE